MNHYVGFCQLLADQLSSAMAAAVSYDQQRQRADALSELDRAKTAFLTMSKAAELMCMLSYNDAAAARCAERPDRLSPFGIEYPGSGSQAFASDGGNGRPT